MREYINIINELTRPENRKNAENILSNAGYEHLGSGLYAGVYSRLDKPYAVKLFSASDTAYLKYLQLCSRVSNKHFPIIIGKPIKITNNYYGVKLEKLEKLKSSPSQVDTFQISRYADDLRRFEIYQNKEFMRSFEKNFPDLAKALNLIQELDFYFDISGSNVMQRADGTVVLTDPVI